MSVSLIPAFEAILQQRLPLEMRSQLALPGVQALHCDLFEKARVQVDVLRCDQVHPVISGNKWFKLKFNLVQAWEQGCTTLASFGGAWSNHLHALAYCAQLAGMHSIGFVRGDELQADANPMLQEAQRWGMELRFLARDAYRHKQVEVPAGTWLIPEGGDNEWGVLGCMTLVPVEWARHYDVIVLPWGTGCTFAGVFRAAPPDTAVWAVSVLKGHWPVQALAQRLQVPVSGSEAGSEPGAAPAAVSSPQARVLTDYHFGGYARVDATLLSFIRDFGDNTGLPLDPVYTGKAMFGLCDRIRRQMLPAGSRVLFIHTGGLQGVRGFQFPTG